MGNEKDVLDSLKKNRFVGLAMDVQERYREDGAKMWGASLAFYGFISLFPLLLLGLSFVGFLFANDPDAQRRWTTALSGAVPGLAGVIGENLQKVVDSRRGAGILGLLGLAWTGTSVIEAAEFALGRVFRVDRIIGFVKGKLEALWIMAGLGTLAMAAVLLAGVAGGFTARGGPGVALKIGVAIFAFILDFLLFLVAYRLLIPQRGPRFNVLWPGATFAAAGWSLLKIVGAAYVKRTTEGAGGVYGTFAAVIGALALLYLASRLFMYGAELNAVLIERHQQAETPAEEEVLQASPKRGRRAHGRAEAKR